MDKSQKANLSMGSKGYSGDSLPPAPFITVVIPLYNKESTIAQTIQSVLDQTYQDFELVIVNDGSKDDSVATVSAFEGPRIRLINQENAGVSAARNRGVKEARGEYVAFLDADDHWTPNHLEEIAALIRDYGDVADVFATNFFRQFADGDNIINRKDLRRDIVENYFKSITRTVLINSSCVCISKDAFISVGGFREQFSMGEDIDLWNRLCRRYKIAFSPEATSIYMIDAPNNSRSRKIDYSRDAASVSLRGVSSNLYDIQLSLSRFLKYIVKRLINYHPRVRKPL